METKFGFGQHRLLVKLLFALILLLFSGGIVLAAVGDIQWDLGSVTTYSSTGGIVTTKWGLGSVMITHEYVAGGTSIPIFMYHYLHH